MNRINLENLIRIGKLKAEQPSRMEFEGDVNIDSSLVEATIRVAVELERRIAAMEVPAEGAE